MEWIGKLLGPLAQPLVAALAPAIVAWVVALVAAGYAAARKALNKAREAALKDRDNWLAAIYDLALEAIDAVEQGKKTGAVMNNAEAKALAVSHTQNAARESGIKIPGLSVVTGIIESIIHGNNKERDKK
jgi:hypothetical protein